MRSTPSDAALDALDAPPNSVERPGEGSVPRHFRKNPRSGSPRSWRRGGASRRGRAGRWWDQRAARGRRSEAESEAKIDEGEAELDVALAGGGAGDHVDVGEGDGEVAAEEGEVDGGVDAGVALLERDVALDAKGELA